MGKVKEIIDLSFPRVFRFFASQSLQSDGQVLVGKFQGMVVGFVKLTQFQVGGYPFGCVLWLAVHPDFRRKSFGSKLVKAGTEYLLGQGSKAVFASVQRRNHASLAVLQREGFRRIGWLELWGIFGWRIFQLFYHIWLAPSEVVLMKDKA